MDLSDVPASLSYYTVDVPVGGTFPTISSLLVAAVAGASTGALTDVAVGDYTTGLSRNITSPGYTPDSVNTSRLVYWTGAAVYDFGVAFSVTGYAASMVEDYVSGDVAQGIVSSETHATEISSGLRVYGSSDGTTWTALDSQLNIGYSGRSKAGTNPIVIQTGPPPVTSVSNLVQSSTGFTAKVASYRYFGCYFFASVLRSFYAPFGLPGALSDHVWSASLSDFRLYTAASGGGDRVVTKDDLTGGGGGAGSECDCTWTRDDGPAGTYTRVGAATTSYTRDAGTAGDWTRRRC